MAKKETSYDWNIHVVRNGTCDLCGKSEAAFREGMCDAHTHGLDKYGSLELQIVLDMDPAAIGYILNSVGELVRDGLKLEDGIVFSSDKFQEGVRIKVFETEDVNGEPIYRLILPDTDYCFPEGSLEYPYNKQYVSPYMPTYN